MYEINEVMALVFGVIGLVLLLTFLKKGLVPWNVYLVSAYCIIFASNVFTVAEGFFLYTLFNFLEHAAYLAAAACTLAGVIAYARGRA